MYVTKIKYTDFDGNEREEEHCFHLSKKEIIDWLYTNKGTTLDKVLERLRQEQDNKKIMEIFDDLICRSYGRKSLDGRKFEKTDEILKDFKSTTAYSDFFMDLLSGQDKSAEFVKGILPMDVLNSIMEEVKVNPESVPADVRSTLQIL